jgi:hypothetical protein
MNKGPDALGTAENESRRAKHESGTRRPLYRRKMSGDEKHKNEIGRPRYRRKIVRTRKNMKTRPDAFGPDENESKSAKHENGIPLPRYRRK